MHLPYALKYLFAAMVLALELGAAWADTANAQTAECKVLKAELVSLGRSYNSKQYKASARKQKVLIDRTQAKMNGHGCSKRKRYLLREAHPSCVGLRNSLKSMKRNLAILQSKARGDGRTSNTNERRRIKRAMRVAGCRESGNKLIAQLFGTSTAKARRKKTQRNKKNLQAFLNRRVRTTEETIKDHGTFRTMCVRTCDGYAFPVSFSTKRSSMQRDAAACNVLCPGRKMKLYYHRTAKEGLDDMVAAVDGTPYSKLPTANAFRKTYNPDCACNFRLLTRKQQPLKKLTRAEILEQLYKPKSYSPIGAVAKPVWRVKAQFEVPSVDKDTAEKRTSPLKPRKSKVRVVGDAYFPNQ